MNYREHLAIPMGDFRDLDLRCQNAIPDNPIKDGATLFDKHVVFINGNKMAIQVINSRSDSAWCQGVLFSDEGHELACTEVIDNLRGPYVLEYEGDTYTVYVNPQGEKKTYTRYLIIKVEVTVDGSNTDQDMDAHVDEIMDSVSSELEYNVSYSGTVEAGSDADDSIEVPVAITDTEVVEFTDSYI